MVSKINLKTFRKEIRNLNNPKRAVLLSRYFKTGKGEYAEGDKFLGGIDTPTLTKLIVKYNDLSLFDVQQLLESEYHEERMAALGILKKHFERAKGMDRKKIVKFYLKNTRYINNWDLVDVTAPKILGTYLLENSKDMAIIDKLSESKDLWERRIAIISTFAFIRENNFNKTLEFAKAHLNDSEDLIHKAVGWALREIGKRKREVEETFLNKYYKKMPRTMLRYAIEKFPEPIRRKYLLGKI